MKPSRALSIFCLATTTMLWAFSALVIRYLSDHYDGFTQNMYRYGVSSAFLFALSLARRRNVFGIGGKNLLRLLGPTIPNVGFQILWVAALYVVYPGFAAVLVRIWVFLSILLAVILFPQERAVAKRPKFILGVLLSFGGMASLMCLGSGTFDLELDVGILLVLAAALAWAMYSVEIRRVVDHVKPSDAFVVVSIYTTAILAVLAFVFGSPAKIFSASLAVNIILVVSGLGCIAVAHTAYYIAIRGLGICVCTTFLLLSCILTAGLSYLIFHEPITPGQVASGIVLVLGSTVVVWAAHGKDKGKEKTLSE